MAGVDVGLFARHGTRFWRRGRGHGTKHAVRRPGPPDVQPGPIAAAASLTAAGERVFKLGGHTGGSGFFGNGVPGTGVVWAGEQFVVQARFAQRGLSVPAVSHATFRVVCQGATPRAGGGNTTSATFLAVAPGSAQIQSSTNDCGLCAGFVFEVGIDLVQSGR